MVDDISEEDHEIASITREKTTHHHSQNIEDIAAIPPYSSNIYPLPCIMRGVMTGYAVPRAFRAAKPMKTPVSPLAERAPVPWTLVPAYPCTVRCTPLNDASCSKLQVRSSLDYNFIVIAGFGLHFSSHFCL